MTGRRTPGIDVRVDAARTALLGAAAAIQALHPGEVKNSVLFLQARAADLNTLAREQGLPPEIKPQTPTHGVPADPDLVTAFHASIARNPVGDGYLYVCPSCGANGGPYGTPEQAELARWRHAARKH